ncbi:flavodoxin-dependent (E)-4-hydroxy-3-methylbut-2-enyl-diphosphate synthase [Candidatus Poribacteria bacterium]|nr:flavodoxin-dependent (E)-4-hydroxy-3-methylbut-2-enyl-diphosphate synthase [Candidatus Poribacteria bacterium]
MTRRISRAVKVGNITIGANAPISVQSMTNTDTKDVPATIAQIKRLEEAGCEIIRVAVPDMAAAESLKAIKQKMNVPLVADIHFDYRLALTAIDSGVDKLRINPGNIGSEDRVKAVVKAARERKVPIRIGVNAGSLEDELLEKYGHSCPEALVESAQKHIKILEQLDFYEIVISLKDSNVINMIDSYRLMAEQTDYPLHLGVTEAGTKFTGTIKSAIGIGVLLYEGIGDTIRVSLTEDPAEEVKVGFEILKSLGLRVHGPNIIACPTCGRCQINLIDIAYEIERRTAHIKKPLNIAVMGCVVNGPGEAKGADIGIAGGKGKGVIFKRGVKIKTVAEENLIEEFLAELEGHFD